MIGLNVRVLGTRALSNVLKSTAATSEQKAQRKVSWWAHVLEAKIKSRAPVRTGDYRRSWNTQMHGSNAIVGTNKPQARRLEYGFVGTDSLGRRYNQAPRPHVRPSVDEVRDPYLRDMAKVIRR